MLHKNHCAPRHVSAWTATLFKDARVAADSLTATRIAQAQCLLVFNRNCKHISVLDVPTSKNLGDSNVASIKAMHWDALYIFICQDGCYREDIAQRG